MTQNMELDDKALGGVSRRDALRSGLVGTTIMLTVSKSKAIASDAPPAAAGVAGEVPFGVRVTPGVGKHVGTDITVFWRGKLCIHARYCVTEAAQVFTQNGRWDLSQETADQIAHVVRKCPSGALTYERTDGGPQELTPRVNVIRLHENGPLAVHADLQLPGAEPMKRATLCRCGKSKNKPFCDSSHNAAGFVATGQAASTSNTGKLDNRGGRLHVTAMRDGPYQVRGNVEICAATGRVIARTSGALLCRCGQSATKPFCDGAHLGASFVAEGA